MRAVGVINEDQLQVSKLEMIPFFLLDPEPPLAFLEDLESLSLLVFLFLLEYLDPDPPDLSLDLSLLGEDERERSLSLSL